MAYRENLIQERYQVRGKRLDNGELLQGYYVPVGDGRATIVQPHQRSINDTDALEGTADVWLVDPATVQPVAADLDKADSKNLVGICRNCRRIESKIDGDEWFCRYCGQRLSWPEG